MKKFLYFPSFDTAVAKNAGIKDFKLKNGTPWRFWKDEYPRKYQHKYFLTTAGHNFKKPDHIKGYDFPNDMLVLGDSGGYQICSGAIKWNESLLPLMFAWLENNSNIAMNLDIPPRMKMSGRFNECLDISVKNFKYFADRQTGKTDFLNIIQGSNYEKYKVWYNSVKGLPFSGWAIGGAGGSISSVMSGLTVLLESGEILNPTNKWLHILGASGVVDFLMFAKIQHEINKLGSNIVLTTDSSTPSRSTSYGFYYTGFDLREAKFRYINLPNKKEKLYDPTFKVNRAPIITEIDDLIWENYTLDEFLNWDQYHYAWLVSHNFAIFLDCYRACCEIISADEYIVEQCFNSNIVKLLKSIEELVHSSNPAGVLRKYNELYVKMNRISYDSIENSNINEFF